MFMSHLRNTGQTHYVTSSCDMFPPSDLLYAHSYRSKTREPNDTTKCLELLLPIQFVPGSSLCPKTGCTERVSGSYLKSF